ncbi:MAG: hypothetical protein VYC01_02170 [Nitrospinota bacterium]|nr:hypothetical protein [Nitrospinota bacterium]
MKKLILVSIIFCFTLLSSIGFANELLVLSGDKSQNSKRWQQEVLPEYNKSNPGKNLPAKIVPIKGKLFPEWFAQAIDDGRVGEIVGTPTFLIWDSKEKKEIGRIEGYTQKTRFFSQLVEAINLVEQGQHPGKREGSGGHRDEGSGGDQRQEEGSGNSSNIMDHIYKTPEEAKKASEMLGLGGEIHSHETADGTIYMPGSTM